MCVGPATALVFSSLFWLSWLVTLGYLAKSVSPVGLALKEQALWVMIAVVMSAMVAAEEGRLAWVVLEVEVEEMSFSLQYVVAEVMLELVAPERVVALGVG